MDTEICLIINHFAIICEYVPCFQGFETYQDTRKVTFVLMIGHGEVPSRLPNKERHFPLTLIWQSWAPLQGLPQVQSHPSQDCGLCGKICIQRLMRLGYKGSLNHFIQQGTTLQAIVAPELPGKGTKLLSVSIVPLLLPLPNLLPGWCWT